MLPYKTYAVVGGDLRYAHIANRLAAENKKVYALLLSENAALHRELVCDKPPAEILPICDVVIFPLPMTLDDKNVNAPFSAEKATLADCLFAISPHTAVFGGKVSEELRKHALDAGVTLVDYLEREELAVKNAVITAEGALAIALEELPIALFGSRCVITGHGRIARALARGLRGMGARVTVAARKYGELAEIEAEGCTAISFAALTEKLSGIDVLFNTVPARVLGREQLSALKKDALVIDLASRPGGVDLKAAAALGVKTIWALSLPGKTAPITAGDMILATIENCLREREL